MPLLNHVMSIDRRIFKSSFRGKGLTKWNCPTCGKGFLKVKPSTFHSEETRASRRERSYDDWEPEWIRYVYSCLLECNNTACKEIVSSSGVGYTEQYIGYDEEQGEYVGNQNCFSPKYFSPHLKIFNYQKNIPDEVTDELDNSFSLFFCDPPSSANHIRMALENLLTHMRINKTVTKNGKRRDLMLHERINLLPQKYHDIQELFMAVKWLGNAGSHSGATVSSDDVLDAYELMEHLLTEIFNEERKKNLKALAKNINKKKGPTTKSGLA